jgi:hypothetical protein
LLIPGPGLILAGRSFRAAPCASATLPMAYTKRRVRQHVMEDRSIRIVRDLLPDHWVVREYRPDYGIDLLVELFEPVNATDAATVGETLFVQVKSAEIVEPRRLRVRRRRNVELGPLREDPSDSVEIPVARLRLDTSELLTIQAIGSAIPVLLFLVELSTRRIYFVCLNDLVEKVIIPQDPGYAAKNSKVIHIPLRNRIVADDPVSIRPLETYAKRPKLYAAFQKFAYQKHEMEYLLAACGQAGPEERQSEHTSELMDLVRHFLAVILRYDFWERVPEWQPIGWSYRELTSLREITARPGVENDLAAIRTYLLTEPSMRRDEKWVRALDLPGARHEFFAHIRRTWEKLENLSRMYEEIGREWFLPTSLSEGLVDI